MARKGPGLKDAVGLQFQVYGALAKSLTNHTRAMMPRKRRRW